MICQLHSEETRFLETSAKSFILESIFEVFWVPPNVPRINKKSSSRSSGAKRASGRYHHQPTWLQEPILIDFASMFWGWIDQVLETKLRIPDRRHRPQGLYNPPRCEGFTAAGRVGSLCLQSLPPAHPLYNFLHTSCEAVAKATS